VENGSGNAVGVHMVVYTHTHTAAVGDGRG